MVNIKEPDQRSEDACDSSTHGVQTYTVLPTTRDILLFFTLFFLLLFNLHMHKPYLITVGYSSAVYT